LRIFIPPQIGEAGQILRRAVPVLEPQIEPAARHVHAQLSGDPGVAAKIGGGDGATVGWTGFSGCTKSSWHAQPSEQTVAPSKLSDA
jgi:hypothetical protein